ncbi:MAG: DASS family sodium-coupled anion symporter [Bacteroidales bacterium]|nr:DASS family sodium-coupled anion symporter [Bacteroidales bacterium]
MEKKFNVKYWVFLPLVLAITLFLWLVPVSFFGIDGLTVVQQRVIALFVFAALMWIFEIIPNWATSLLVIVISLLTMSNKGIGFFCNPDSGSLVTYTKIMSSMADPVVMLFLGGFVLAIMAEKYGLDVTLARALLKLFGKNPNVVLLGFLIMISVFSMFMSNTATAAMMLALLAPVLSKLPADDKGKIGLALSIPVAANIGGIGTPIGTPPNATAKGALENAGFEVGFGDWCVHMIPYVIIMIVIAWVLLRLFFPFKTKELILEIPENKQPRDWKSKLVWITFFGTILLWATEKLTGINSNIVAWIPLGVFTATGVFGKDDIKKINWNVLWLVAGGFCLGYLMDDVEKGGTGLGQVLIDAIPFGQMSVILVLVVAGLVCYFLSNFISNSATAALLIPLLIHVARGMAAPTAANNAQFLGMGGTSAMIIFIAVCASIAMLFPISTPPNAIASATGMVETKDMTKVGIIIGVVGFIFGFFWLTKIFPFKETEKAVAEKNIVWSSTNKPVATVSGNGEVKALSPGVAYIIAEAKDKTQLKIWKVVVIKKGADPVAEEHIINGDVVSVEPYQKITLTAGELNPVLVEVTPVEPTDSTGTAEVVPVTTEQK